MENFIHFDAQKNQLNLQGAWTLVNIPTIKKIFRRISLPSLGSIKIDCSGISTMDSAGAWLLNKLITTMNGAGLKTELLHLRDEQQTLLELIQRKAPTQISAYQPEKPYWLTQVGKNTVTSVKEGYDYLNFVGGLTVEALRIVAWPRHMRLKELAGNIYKAGVQALPIIAILSLMIGIIIAHQTSVELHKYGADIFVVEFVGYSIFREFGPLTTAIIVAARSGSAFTAQLGTMKINQEIDALNTMGVTPAELLLLPRVLALFITLPLLTIWSDVFGVIGGMLATMDFLHISWGEFLNRFQREVPLRVLLIGLSKTPVFALIIASIGCFQGMQVEKNADSVGRLTTRSVVLSIFFIVVVDAIFSAIFAKFNLFR